MQLIRAALLVVGGHDPPRRVPAVGRPDHLVVGARVVPPAAIGLDVHRAELPLAQRIVDALAEAALLLLLADVEEVLQDLHAALDDRRLEARRELEEAARLLLGAVAHHPLDAGAVVPAAVEDQHLAGGGHVREVALDIHLGLLALGRRRQRHHPEDPRADPLGQALDDPALAGGVAALEDDDDPCARSLHPGLQMRDLDLQAGDLVLVGTVARLLGLLGRRLGRLPFASVSAAFPLVGLAVFFARLLSLAPGRLVRLLLVHRSLPKFGPSVHFWHQSARRLRRRERRAAHPRCPRRSSRGRSARRARPVRAGPSVRRAVRRCRG